MNYYRRLRYKNLMRRSRFNRFNSVPYKMRFKRIGKVRKMGKGKGYYQKTPKIIEKKHIDTHTNWSGNDTDLTAVGKILNPIGTGTTQGTRIGDKIIMKDLSIRFSLVKNSNDTEQATYVRAVIGLSKSPVAWQNASDWGENIFENYGEITSLYNVGKIDDFKILYDRTYKLGKYDYTTDLMQSGMWNTTIDKIFIPMNVEVQYNSTAPTGIEHFEKGCLFMLVYSDSTLGDGPIVTTSWRVSYLDA